MIISTTIALEHNTNNIIEICPNLLQNNLYNDQEHKYILLLF